jgi:hypothetical protein
MPILKAALVYFMIVFAVGFLCGPIRVSWLEPNFGATAAVLLELPILVMAMIFSARFVPRKLQLAPRAGAHLGMGFAALALVLMADFCVGLFLRQQSPGEIAAYFLAPAGRIYSGALLGFALMPWLVNWRLRKA